MQQSMYFEYVQKYFPGLVTSVVERINEKREAQPMNFRNLLVTEYSADARWSSVLADYSRVAADVVAMDSELPLKSRDTVSTVTGDIPKMGLKKYLNEKTMKDLQSMIANNLPTPQILRKLFEDVPTVIQAIDERIEDIFLSELSSGVGVSDNNNGTGVRINVGYDSKNKFGATVAWQGNQSTALPLDDIQKVFDKAQDDQNIITDIWADDTWLQAFYRSEQVRAQFAFDNGVTTVNNSVPVLDFSKAQAVLRTKWGIEIHRIARKIRTEINGIVGHHTPWANGVAAFTCDEKLGRLIWTDVVEASRPVGGVAYQTAEEYILVSQYAQNDPWREFTASQAMVVPVLDNVDRIYLLDSTKVQG